MSKGELDFIKWIRKITGKRDEIPIDIGDDAACYKTNSKYQIITTDILLDGVHFKSENVSAWKIGRKAMAKNLSDIAAMGCYPTYAVCSIAFPRARSISYAKKLYLGMKEAASKFGTKLIGGDLSSWNDKIAVSITLVGESRDLKPIRRSGAKVGDSIMVTGTLGGSIITKYINFTPRVKEAITLNKNFKIHSCIDITDGLVRDLAHICEESGVGATIWDYKIPISKDAMKLAKKTGKMPIYHALYDGEDYELLFTVSKAEAKKIIQKKLATSIGEIIGAEGIYLKDISGSIIKLHIKGYEHQFG